MKPVQPPAKPPLLSLRSLVLLAMAIAIGLAAGALTYVSELSTPASILLGAGAFATTLKLLHDLVE